MGKKDDLPWTIQEDNTLLRQVGQRGGCWKDIATFLPGRTENSVRNRFARLSTHEPKPGAGAYKCGRCGTYPKRGHVCPARVQTAETFREQVAREEAAVDKETPATVALVAATVGQRILELTAVEALGDLGKA